MYFEMAWQFGCTVEELLQRVSSRELTSWRALFRIREREQRKAESDARRTHGGARR